MWFLPLLEWLFISFINYTLFYIRLQPHTVQWNFQRWGTFFEIVYTVILSCLHTAGADGCLPVWRLSHAQKHISFTIEMLNFDVLTGCKTTQKIGSKGSCCHLGPVQQPPESGCRRRKYREATCTVPKTDPHAASLSLNGRKEVWTTPRKPALEVVLQTAGPKSGVSFQSRCTYRLLLPCGRWSADGWVDPAW